MRGSARFLGVAFFLLALPALSQTVPPLIDHNSAPSMTADAGGGFHVVWLEGAVGEYTIFYSTNDGRRWSDPEIVAAGVSVIDLQILIRPDGVPCAVWSLLQLFQSCRTPQGWSQIEVVAERSFSATYRSAYAPSGELEVLYLEPTSAVFFDEILLNSADEVVTFPEFAIDANGGYHAFWWDFTEDRGWMWSHSADGGTTWTGEASLSTTLPLAGGTLVGVDSIGGVHNVLLGAFDAHHLYWTSETGWSPTESIEFDPPAARGDLAIGDGDLFVVTAGNEGVFSIAKPARSGWGRPEPVDGTEGRSIDSVLVALRRDGRAEVLWHEVGAVGFNQVRVGGETLASAVPAPADVNLDPIVIATSVAITAGLLFLVPFPAEIFNNTLAEHHDEIVGWFRRRATREGKRLPETPGGLVLFFFAGALLYGFLDPGFGLNASSAATFLGLLAGVVITTFGFALPTLVLRRIRVKEWGRLRALPLALLVGIGCVLLSRAIGFLPGYLYGIVLGVAFRREVSDQEEAREVAVASSVVMALSVGSWVLLGFARRGPGSGVLADMVEASLATVVVSGFEALMIGLLPLGGMPGKVLFDQNKVGWIVIWGLSVLAFFHALVNPQSGYLADTALVPVVTTIGLLVVFTLISFALWGYFRLRERRDPTAR